MKKLALAFLFLLVAVSASNVTLNGTGQTVTVPFDGCASFVVNDTVVGTACGVLPNFGTSTQFTWGGNFQTPVLNATGRCGESFYNTPFPSLNKLVLLSCGESYSPADSRYALNVSSAPATVCPTSTPTPTPGPTVTPNSECDIRNVHVLLNEGETWENVTCGNRVEAVRSERVAIEKPLYPGENYTVRSKYITEGLFTCQTRGAETLNATASVSPTPVITPNPKQNEGKTSTPAPVAEDNPWIMVMAGVSVLGTLFMVGVAAFILLNGRNKQSPLSNQKNPTFDMKEDAE